MFGHYWRPAEAAAVIILGFVLGAVTAALIYGGSR